MSDLIRKVQAAIDAAPWVERRNSFGAMHDTLAEARAAIEAVAEWLKEGRPKWQGDYLAGACLLNQLEQPALRRGLKVAGAEGAHSSGIEVTGGDRRKAVKQIPEQPEADIKDSGVIAATPATDAAPAVCVWTRISEFDTVVHYSTPHGVMNDLHLWRGLQCSTCRAPIKFTEANHG